MKLQIYDLLRLITIFQFFFFAFFLLNHKKGSALSNRIFAVFLVGKALCYVDGMLWSYWNTIPEWAVHLLFMGESFDFILGPALYFYILSLAYKDFKFKRLHLLHLIPFVLHWLALLPNYYIYGFAGKMELINGGLKFDLLSMVVVPFFIYLHFIGYSVFALLALRKYRARLKNIFSTVEKTQLSWLSMVTAGFIVIWVAALVNLLFALGGRGPLVSWTITLIFIFIFANLIVFKGLKHPEIFGGIETEEPAEKQAGIQAGKQVEEAAGKSTTEKYVKTQLTEDTQESYLKRLLQYMEKEKPYLDPNLSIKDVAQNISIPSYSISQVINSRLRKNFFHFVNDYRIDESKALLKDGKNGDRSVLEILYDCGFNSKSTFNKAFKKATGMTPSQYKRTA